MSFGVDYSYSWPTVAQLKTAGVKFVVRYLTGTTSASYGSKNLTPKEAAELQAAGIDIVSNYETSAGFMLNGYDAGARAAEAAWKQHKWCGGPDGRPIYFSLDMDATLDQYRAALQFMRGAGSVIGWNQVGMYGGLFQVDWAAQDGVRWLWQTYAWSYGQWSSYAHALEQYRNGQALGNGTVDYDRSLLADFGQWSKAGTGDSTVLDATDKQWLLDNLRGDRAVTLSTVTGKVEAVYNQVNTKTGGLYNQGNNILNAINTVLFGDAPGDQDDTHDYVSMEGHYRLLRSIQDAVQAIKVGTLDPAVLEAAIAAAIVKLASKVAA